MNQFDGLEAGYNSQAAKGFVPAIPHFAFQMLNGVGDLFDISESHFVREFLLNNKNLNFFCSKTYIYIYLYILVGFYA
jgi:hypothetical protein